MKIAFVGMGNMGEAMVAALLARGVADAGELSGSDVLAARRQYLSQKYGVRVRTSAVEAIGGAEVVVLAFKPQDLVTATAEFAGQLGAEQVVLSILAGTRIETLERLLEHRRIVRVMPNTPAQVGQGMSVWTATREVSAAQKLEIAEVLGAMGRETYVDDESYLDMATAISGSGPAYVFMFMEALEAAAVGIGFSEATARQLVLQTVLGSARYLEESGLPPAELRRMVTSPGGTTAEAIARFEAGGLVDLVAQAVRAAYAKAQGLDS